MLGPYDYFAIEWGYKPIPGGEQPGSREAELRTVTRCRLERHIRESQEAGRIGRSGETFDEGRFDLIDIRLALRVVALRLPVRIEVRGLPLRHARGGASVIVACAECRGPVAPELAPAPLKGWWSCSCPRCMTGLNS